MKKCILSLFLLIFLLSISTFVGATVVTYDEGTGDWNYDYSSSWETMEGYEVAGTVGWISLDHSSYYYWGFEDSSFSAAVDNPVYLVFHDIYDWIVEDDFLNIYIKDGGAEDTGYQFVEKDAQSLDYPDWIEEGWTQIQGTWSDPYGGGGQNVYDVVFEISPDILASVVNGDTFQIGIDPDCHFFGSEITIEAAPVPEPATMILLGSGLIGLAGFGRKRFSKKG